MEEELKKDTRICGNFLRSLAASSAPSSSTKSCLRYFHNVLPVQPNINYTKAKLQIFAQDIVLEVEGWWLRIPKTAPSSTSTSCTFLILQAWIFEGIGLKWFLPCSGARLGARQQERMVREEERMREDKELI